MQNFAINLRQKHEYTRAKQLLKKAIEVKKDLNKGSEVHAEIAYMYSELAVTYHSA
jgi:Tfp pilus assembly protein PilF